MDEQLCTHLDAVLVTDVPDPPLACEECVKIGSDWVHLRMCHTCGSIGCCDESPNRHATAHFRETDHPLMRSVEPGEEWTWCYVDEVGFILRAVPAHEAPESGRRHRVHERHHSAHP